MQIKFERNQNYGHPAVLYGMFQWPKDEYLGRITIKELLDSLTEPEKRMLIQRITLELLESAVLKEWLK